MSERDPHGLRAGARERPLSPHIGIYRKTRYSLLSSITNRATGALLSLGLIVLVYWLAAVAQGQRAYARASVVLASAPLRVLYALLILAFCYHLTAGVRHLVWDTGHGLERSQSRRSATLVAVVALALAVLVCWWALSARAGPP
jgi:succinate dehydrogenase / fumarate reductase, cytochrome b subunit